PWTVFTLPEQSVNKHLKTQTKRAVHSEQAQTIPHPQSFRIYHAVTSIRMHRVNIPTHQEACVCVCVCVSYVMACVCVSYVMACMCVCLMCDVLCVCVSYVMACMCVCAVVCVCVVCE